MGEDTQEAIKAFVLHSRELIAEPFERRHVPADPVELDPTHAASVLVFVAPDDIFENRREGGDPDPAADENSNIVIVKGRGEGSKGAVKSDGNGKAGWGDVERELIVVNVDFFAVCRTIVDAEGFHSI